MNGLSAILHGNEQDASTTDAEGIASALARIGRDEALREQMIDLLRKAERRLARPDLKVRGGFDVRAEITGEICDALCRDAGLMCKRLKQGITFSYTYTSRIARAVTLSPDREPDHVWEPQTTKLLLALAENADHVLIGGAYAGDHALLLAQQLAALGDGGVVHAFEPNDALADLLDLNIRQNNLTNILVSRLGLWRQEGKCFAFEGDDSDAHGIPVASPDQADFVTTTIDAYVRERQLPGLDVIMLDIEGAEHAALEGALDVLSRPAGQSPHVIFEIHRSYVDWSDGLLRTPILEMLTDLGYFAYAIRDFHSNYPMGDSPVELIRPETTWLEGPPHGFNMVAVKTPDLLEQDERIRILDGVSPKLLLHKDPALHHPSTRPCL